jgi:hypothetical protein
VSDTITTDPAAVWAALSALTIGDVVPSAVYVLDYADDQRPVWEVADREVAGPGLRLVLADRANADLFNHVVVTVLTFPAKTLRTQPYLSGGSMPGKLCCMLQQARKAAKRI